MSLSPLHHITEIEYVNEENWTLVIPGKVFPGGGC